MVVPALLDGYNAFNEVIREVARANGPILVEAAHSIPADADHFADSFHFTDAVSEVMVQLVSRSISAPGQFRRIVPAPITKPKSTTTPVATDADVNTL